MKNYDLEKEQKKHPYEYYGRVFEVTYKDTDFAVKTALRYVVDDYDEYLGSVEQSHYEEVGYNVVFNYNQDDDNEELDFTWMPSNDVFDIAVNLQNNKIRTVKANIDNIGMSHLIDKKNMFHDVDLEIYDNDSTQNIVSKVMNLRYFVQRNKKALSGNIKLEGFSPITKAVLGHYAKEFGLKVNNKHNNKVNTKY